jgi:uncharacterized repeat protein (TIGR01451 family)
MLAPQRMMAPVGSEIVLVSGLYGERGAYVPRQKIEWTLSPDSVGQILDASEERHCLKRFLHNASTKRDGKSAFTETSATGQVLTRGTPNPADDVTLLPGQSWISVTSPTEGASHVTVLAPQAENWDRRRQTATIYWVDVQWLLPAPAIVPASQPHTLAVTLRRASGKPLPGWIVRYELTTGADGASFGTDRQTVMEVPTDQNGLAQVTLVAAHKSGTSQVLIRIIRPANLDDDLPAMVVGQGFTSVTWSAPDPKVTLYGPESAGLASTTTYRADVSNAGDVVSRQVVASTAIPPNMTFLQSEPPAKVVGNSLTWELGDLAPGAGRSIRISCRPDRNATVRFCVRIASADALQGQKLAAEACVQTRVFSSALAVRMQGPATAEVGQTVTCEIELTNTGTEPLTNVRIRDRLPPGLQHPTQAGSLIERTLTEPLPPGGSRKIAVELVIRQTGRLCHSLDATADGGHVATASHCVEATAPPVPQPQPATQTPTQPEPGTPIQPPAQPQLQAAVRATIDGPDESRVGQEVTYTMRVTNTGAAPLTNVRIVNTAHLSLSPREASAGYDERAARQGQLVWLVQQLPSGESATREAKYECEREASAAWCRLSVDTAETRSTAEKVTRIRPKRSPRTEDSEVRPPVEKQPESVTGELRVSLADAQDPIAVNATVTYYLAVENARNVSDRRVAITIVLPPGLDFVKLNRPEGLQSRSGDGRMIQLTPIAELRQGETIRLSFEARGRQIGKHTVKVTVDSYRSAKPAVAETDTTVTVSG